MTGGAGYRVVLAKPGLDGHNRGIRVLRRALLDAGFEVIYLGLRRRPSEIAAAAVEEDAECVGLSVLSGAHRTLFPAVRRELDARGADSMPIVGGGIIPDEDVPWLLERGVAAIYQPGASLAEVVSGVEAACAAYRAA